MLPELNNIFKIIQKTSTKKTNQPNPHDPKVEYNNIFLKLISVSKIGQPNNRYEKTKYKPIPKKTHISSINYYPNNYSNENEILPNVYYVNNGNRFPLSLSIKKLNDPISYDKITLSNINKAIKKTFKKRPLNDDDNNINLNNSDNNELEKQENLKKYFIQRNTFSKYLIDKNSFSVYQKSHVSSFGLPEIKEQGSINYSNMKHEKSFDNQNQICYHNTYCNGNNYNNNNNSYTNKKTETNNNINKSINNYENNENNNILKKKIIFHNINLKKLKNINNNNNLINNDKTNDNIDINIKENNKNIENYKNNRNNSSENNNIIKVKRHFNFVNRDEIKNNIVEEKKNPLSNLKTLNFSKKIFEISKKNFNFQKEKKIKITVPEKVPFLQLTDSFENNFSSREEIEKKLNYKFITYTINPNMYNSSNTYYYFINRLYRNNLSDYFSHRINWECVTSLNDPDYPIINFQWRYYSNKVNFSQFKYDPNLPVRKLRVVNLFQRNYEIGNKKNLFINLVQYCDKMNINVFDIVPFTIIIQTYSLNDCFDSLFEIFQLIQNNINVNGEKDIIANKTYSELFSFDKNFSELKNTPIYINKYFLSQKNYWILKPTDLYQGICIEILSNYEDIVKYSKKMFKGVDKKCLIENIEEENDEIEENVKIINTNINEIDDEYDDEEYKKKKRTNSMYISNSIVLQKYLDNPLLYNKRKFDIRCYVLVDFNLNVFFCREGHLKGSSEKYDLNNPNKFIHITNHSLQKKSNKFEKYEYGNEMSYNDFKTFLKSENISLDKFDKLINDMKFSIEISMNAIGKKFFKTENVLCFEVFGYDFIVDKNFKPWILEINNNPGLGISSPVIEKLVPRMMDDALRLTIDKIFETKYDYSCIDKENNQYISKFKLDGFNDDENVFEFLCNISK